MTNRIEEDLLAHYLLYRFSGGQVWHHVRLGQLPDIDIPGLDKEAAKRLLMPSLPEVDAIVKEGDLVYLIEAKVAKEWDCLGKMLIYRYLLPQTDGWKGVDMNKVRMLMVLGRATEPLKRCAAAMNVSLDVYTTPAIRQLLTYGYPSVAP